MVEIISLYLVGNLLALPTGADAAGAEPPAGVWGQSQPQHHLGQEYAQEARHQEQGQRGRGGWGGWEGRQTYTLILAVGPNSIVIKLAFDP